MFYLLFDIHYCLSIYLLHNKSFIIFCLMDLAGFDRTNCQYPMVHLDQVLKVSNYLDVLNHHLLDDLGLAILLLVLVLVLVPVFAVVVKIVVLGHRYLVSITCFKVVDLCSLDGLVVDLDLDLDLDLD